MLHNTARDFSDVGFGKPRLTTKKERIFAPASVLETTTIADPATDIDPKHRSRTMAGMSDSNIMKTYNRPSQFDFGAPTARERMLLRMFDVLRRESPEMKKFIDDYITFNASLSVGTTQVLDCGCCGNPITVSNSNRKGLKYALLRGHICGDAHNAGIVANEPFAGCYISNIPCGCGDTMSDHGNNMKKFNNHKAQCKYASSLASFKIWRGKKENHTAKFIPSTGQFDCGGDIGVVSYVAMRRWLSRVTGKAAYNTGGKKEAVTGNKKAVLEPLIRGMNCYPAEWKSDGDN